MPKENPESLFKKLSPLLYIGVPLITFILIMSFPDTTCERATQCHWGLKGARLLPGPKQNRILLHLHSEGRFKQKSFTKLACVDLDSGALLGQYVTNSWIKPFGLTETHVWVKQAKGPRRWTAYRFPTLDPVCELTELLKAHSRVALPISYVRLDAATGRLCFQAADQQWYSLDPESNALAEQGDPGHDPLWNGALTLTSCESRPPVPGAIGGELLLDGVFVCDNQRGELMDLGDQDRLVVYQDLEGKMGKLILGRLTQGGDWVWQFPEKDLFGTRKREAPGYRVAYATLLKTSMLLVLQQEDAEDDIWVLAMDPRNGTFQWKLCFD